MGAYKSKPITEKCSHHGANEFITYAASSMQGWRMQQEDAHNCLPDFDTARLISLFAVYDGHGGSEVARYCASNLPNFLKGLQAYKDSQPSKALEQLFLDFDASLAMPETRSALQSLMDKDGDESDKEVKKSEGENSDDSEIDENGELKALQDEAEQPLESILERYGGKNALPMSIKTLLDARKGATDDEAIAGPSTSKSSDEEGTAGAPTADKLDKSAGDSKASGDSEEKEGEEASTDLQKTETIGTSKAAGDADVKETVSEETGGGEGEEEDEDSSDESVSLEELQNAELEVDNDDDDEEEDSESDDDDEEDSSDDDDDDEEEEPLRFPIPITDQEEPGVDSGTTACVAVVVPSANGVVRLFVANAGDSRAVLCRGGAAVDLSVDHKPEDEDEKARIIAAGGMVTRDGRVNGGLNLSRALGDHSYKQVQSLSLSEQMITPLPDISQFELVPGADEFLVIACDGVWNSMTSQEVVTFIYDRLHPSSSKTGDTDKMSVDDKSKDSVKLQEICEELFDHCLAPNTDGDGTGCDNMTCVIVRFDDLPGLSRRLGEVAGRSEAQVPAGETKKRVGETIDATDGPAVTVKRTKQENQTAKTTSETLIAVANGGGST